MRNPLTALVLVVVCFASLSAAAEPQEGMTPDTAAAKQESSGGASDGDLAQQAQNPLLPSWSLIARVVAVPLVYPSGASAATGSGSVPGDTHPALVINHNLAPGWYLTSSPFIAASGDGSAARGNSTNSAVAPDWQLRAQIAFLFSD